MRITLIAVLGVLMLGQFGCGSGGRPLPEGAMAVVPAAGTLLYNSEPVAEAIVVFTPVDENLGFPGGSARTDMAGHFVLQAYPTHDGMVPADYKVSVIKTEIIEIETTDPDADKSIARSFLPEKYGSYKTSGLKATIGPDGNEDLLVELKD